MMSVSNPFRGHSRTTDPRNPVWSAGGSVFPTTPAFRYRLGGQHATGDWAFLATTGLLMESWGSPTHDNSDYFGTDGLVPPFQYFLLSRDFLRITDQVLWTLRYKVCLHPYEYPTWWLREREKTNVNMRVPMDTGPPFLHGTPGNVTLFQVEHDSLLPPGGWPPW